MNNCCMSLSGYTYCLNSQVSHDHPCYERNLSNCVHNCDDHGLQYLISNLPFSI